MEKKRRTKKKSMHESTSRINQIGILGKKDGPKVVDWKRAPRGKSLQHLVYEISQFSKRFQA